jgi:hypothetical protein
MSDYEIHLAPRTWGAHEPYLDIPVDIKLQKDDLDRYKVILRSTGQTLGYVWRSFSSDSKGAYWKAGIANSAYYPAGTDILTTCTKHDSHRGGDWHQLEVHPVSSRYEGVQEILYELGRRAAESVEFLVEKARRPFIVAQAEAGQDWAIRHLIETAKAGL